MLNTWSVGSKELLKPQILYLCRPLNFSLIYFDFPGIIAFINLFEKELEEISSKIRLIILKGNFIFPIVITYYY